MNTRVLFLGTDIFAKGGIPRYSVYQIKALKEIFGESNVFVFSLAAFNPDYSFEEKIKTEYVQGGITFLDKLIFSLKAIYFIKNNNISLVVNNHIQLSIISFLAKKVFSISYATNVYGIEIWSGLKKRDIIGLKNSDLIFGDCRFILNYVRTNFGISDSKLNLLHDPVDIERFKPYPQDDNLLAKYAIPKNKFILMTVGRLDIYKGYELVTRVTNTLPEDIIYVIVGDGPDREELLRMRKELNLEARVIFTYRVPEDDLVPLYNLCDIFVLVSRFGVGEGEGLPLALIEASACGKPIIAGNQDGSVDAVDEGINGYIIPSEDAEALKHRILNLFNDAQLKDKMGKAGILKVKREFEFSVFKHNLSEILKKYR